MFLKSQIGWPDLVPTTVKWKDLDNIDIIDYVLTRIIRSIFLLRIFLVAKQLIHK